MERKDNYIVTEQAAPRVAGRAVTAGQTIALTAAEARYEALIGSIRRPLADAAVSDAAPDEQAEPAKPVSKRR